MRGNYLSTILLVAAALMTGCVGGNSKNHREEGEPIVCEFSQKEDVSQIKALFESATVMPFEQTESSYINPQCELLEFNGDYYFINKSRNGCSQTAQDGTCLRFGQDGKFKNSIGKMGDADDQYQDIANVQIDGDNILIYSATAKKIYTYNVDGEFLGSVDTGVGAQQLMKVGDKYYGYFGFDNGQQEERILLYNDSFERIGQFLPSASKIVVFSEDVPSMTLFDGELYVRETYSRNIYKIADDGEVSTSAEFDFKSYNIPEQCFNQFDAFKAMEIMLSNDFALLGRFEQSANYSLANVVYLMKDMHLYNMIGVGSQDTDYKWITSSSIGSNAILFSSVRNISDDGTVTALVDAATVNSFNANNPGFIVNGDILQTLEGTNTLIVKFKVSPKL